MSSVRLVPLESVVDFFYRFILMYMCACIYTCLLHVCLVLTEVRKGVGYTGIRFRNDCEPPRVCWEPNQGLLKEQQTFLTNEEPLQSDNDLVYAYQSFPWFPFYISVQQIMFLTENIFFLQSILTKVRLSQFLPDPPHRPTHQSP